MKKSIYGQRCQLVADCFERAGGPEKVLIVAMDMAKAEHTAMMLRGTGQYLHEKPLRVYNSPAGCEFLLGKMSGMMHKYHIRRENVLIGAEDPGEYSFNFIHRLGLEGFPFVRVNAAKASTLRNNARASSDTIDVDGIAQAIVQQRGRRVQAFDAVYSPMKSAARARRRLRRDETACKNRIHRSIEILLPGFLSHELTGIVPFTEASLSLMADEFCLTKIKHMRVDTLVKRLRKGHTHQPEEAALKLKALTDRVLPPPPAIVDYESANLAAKIHMLRAIRESIHMQETEMARALVQTPGFFFTSIPGVGVPLAGHIVAEYGPVDAWPPVDNMASYAGIVPRQNQTGGSAKPPKVGHLPLDANRILKDYLLQAAYHVGTTGEHRLQEYFRKAENEERRSRLATAKLLLRVARPMVQTEMIYLPLEILDPKTPLPPGYVLAYYQRVAEQIAEKWKGYNLAGIPEELNYLVQWKETVNDIARSTENNT
jgi:transposase